MFYVYVIKNEYGKIYIGQTGDIDHRLKRHNKELPVKKSSYTFKNKGTWKLIYKEEYRTRSEALKREKHLKSHKGRDWIRQNLGS